MILESAICRQSSGKDGGLLIEVTHHLKSNEIEMSGHDGYDVPGKDIVCAAVSVLVETLIASALTLSDSAIQVEKDKGYTKITYDPLTTDLSLQVLLRAFFIGVSGVAEAYPDYVKVQAVEDLKRNGEIHGAAFEPLKS